MTQALHAHMNKKKKEAQVRNDGCYEDKRRRN
jgi:hypothetical protein